MEAPVKKLLSAVLVGFVVFGTLAGCAGFGRGHGPVDAFQFLAGRNPGLDVNVTGVMNEQADPVEILVVVPPGLASLNLVATFSLNAEAAITVVSSGKPVPQENGVTRNDFSSPVLYSLQLPKEKKPWRYRITVREAETNASLSSIGIPEGYMMTPLFSPRVKSYTVDVPYSIRQVKIEAKGQSQNMKSIAIDGAASNGDSASATVDFSSGASRTVAVETLAEDGASRDQYLVTLKRLPADSNAKLESLEIVDAPLFPAFSPTRAAYQTEVPFLGKSFVVKAKAQSKYATITLQTLAVVGRINSGRTALPYKGSPTDRAGAVVDFANGTLLPVIVAVTAEDGGVQEYLVDVARAEPDHNNALAELSVPGTRMSPVFTSRLLSYVVEVPFASTQFVVTAKTQSPLASMELVGASLSGTQAVAPDIKAKGRLDDKAGVTVEFATVERLVVAVAVSAQDGKTAQYLLDVRRGEPDHNNSLNELAVAGSRMSPVFGPKSMTYLVEVPFSTRQFVVTAKAQSPVAVMELIPGPVPVNTVQPELKAKGRLDDKAGVTVEFPTAEKISLAVAVTAQDSRTVQYVLDVRRLPPEANADLGSLAASAGVLSPFFSPRIISYTVSLPSNVASTKLTATTASAVATVAVEGQSTKPAITLEYTVAVANGATETVNLIVTAEDQSQKLYRVRVSREAAVPGAKDANTRLTSLQLAGATMKPAFDPGVLEYAAKLPAATASVTLTAAAESPVAAIAVDGQPLAKTGRVIALDPGAAKTVLIAVTAESGVVAQTLLTLSREDSPAPPPSTGPDKVTVNLKSLPIAKRELSALADSNGSVGDQARITVRYYRTNTVIVQGTTPVSVKTQGVTPVLSAAWVSPGVKLDRGKMIEVEVAIPAGGSNWLHYTEARWSDATVQIDVPFLLFSNNPRVAWPALGKAVKVVGYVSYSPAGPQKVERQSDVEAFESNAGGEYGVVVTFTDAAGKVLATDTVWTKPGLPRSHVFEFSKVLSLPEGATVKYTLAAKAKSGKTWTASGSTQIWTTNLAYEGGFEPVVLSITDDLVAPK
jgi:hypothetical protein